MVGLTVVATGKSKLLIVLSVSLVVMPLCVGAIKYYYWRVRRLQIHVGICFSGVSVFIAFITTLFITGLVFMQDSMQAILALSAFM